MSLRGTLGVLLAAAAWMALLATGIGSVYARHEARKRFVELRALEAERDELNIEWSKLQVMQSGYAVHNRVEELASSLDMRVPDAGDIAIIEVPAADAAKGKE